MRDYPIDPAGWQPWQVLYRAWCAPQVNIDCITLCTAIQLHCLIARTAIVLEAGGVTQRMAKAAWDKLVDEAVPIVVFKIRHWRELHPGGDPLKDAKLINELRQVYVEIPQGQAKLEYVQDAAAELHMTANQLQAIFQPAGRENNGKDDLPPIPGVK